MLYQLSYMGIPAKPLLILIRKKGQKTIPFVFSCFEKPEGLAAKSLFYGPKTAGKIGNPAKTVNTAFQIFS
ncbi:MAG: hypothetical protein EPO07_02830 [Verrucomicrobia bacterium]|nr:MAG: hypothetical protein EPO07_02830 [Verrucomicrobiota bacterium]